ncbi:MAG: adaptor protein MecA [Eubacteriales bacterium]|nr:adaptor protein MecA [Eubacteriales bacterium]
MKIQRINDTQIRCTLTAADLSSRNLKLTELAYGSDKAKELFRDMMEQAREEVGFDADNAPLMIEAIPVASDGVVLIITKVEDPEELDTRFARFTQASEDTSGRRKKEQVGADEILDLFRKVCEAQASVAAEFKDNADKQNSTPQSRSTGAEDVGQGISDRIAGHKAAVSVDLLQSFVFEELDDLIHAAKAIAGMYKGRNILYKIPDGNRSAYQLVLHQGNSTPETFNKVCNIFSEYGHRVPFSDAGAACLLEHGDIVIRSGAVQKLAEL